MKKIQQLVTSHADIVDSEKWSKQIQQRCKSDIDEMKEQIISLQK